MNTFLKKTLTTLVPGIVLLFSFSTCYWDNAEYVYPELNTNCDTTIFSFSAAVKPVLNESCLSCHANNVAASLGGNVKLENHADVKIQAENGKLLGSITHTPGHSFMPKGSAKLPECKIAIIRKWVNSGALND